MIGLDFIMRILYRIVHILDDPQHPLLSPNIWVLKHCGLWHPGKDTKTKLRIFSVYLTVAFFCSQYVKCCIKRTLDSVRPLIQYVPFHVSVLKATFFFKDHEKWCDLIGYISSVETGELAEEEPEVMRIMKRYIRYSHRLTYFFWIMALLSNWNICASEDYIDIFDGYTPFSRDPPGYYFVFMTQYLFAQMVTIYVCGYDTCVAAMMIFFAAQLKVSGIYCEKAFKSDTEEENHKNIVECHRFHTKLVKYQELFNSLISPVMFVYLIVTSVNLGVCIIEMVELQDNPAALFSYCVYVLACMIQLLLFYWHGNEVIEESLLVSYSTFKSNWVGASLRMQKQIAILAHTTNKRLVFRAGPVNEISLATYVSILRGSYSFYTLLNETN